MYFQRSVEYDFWFWTSGFKQNDQFKAEREDSTFVNFDKKK
jgi:hypothetical protein